MNEVVQILDPNFHTIKLVQTEQNLCIRPHFFCCLEMLTISNFLKIWRFKSLKYIFEHIKECIIKNKNIVKISPTLQFQGG